MSPKDAGLPSFRNLQALRVVAAILVVLFHFAPHYNAAGGSFWLVRAVAPWGFVGVDVFFVISGFIMGHTTFDKPRTLAQATQFASHRLGRIYLGYWPFFGAALLLARLLHPETLARTDLLGSFFLSNTNLFVLLIPVTWSLTHELYFYLLFVASFALSARMAQLIFQIAFLAVLLRLIFVPLKEGLLSFFFSEFVVEFLAGTSIFIYRRQLRQIWVPWLFVPLGVACFYWGVHLTAANGSIRIYTFGTSAASLLVTALWLEARNVFRAGAFLGGLGDSSYTLYLCHLPLVDIVYFSGLRDFIGAQSPLMRECGFALLLSLFMAVSWLFYRGVERPIYRAFARKTSPRSEGIAAVTAR